MNDPFSLTGHSDETERKLSETAESPKNNSEFRIANSELNLRPHHIFCLRFFEGRGYSEAFVKNTYAVLDRLREEGRFTVVFGPDALCEACPNLHAGGCVWQNKIMRYDEAAASLLGVRENEAYLWSGFTKETAQTLIPAICADCEWYGLCANK